MGNSKCTPEIKCTLTQLTFSSCTLEISLKKAILCNLASHSVFTESNIWSTISTICCNYFSYFCFLGENDLSGAQYWC